MGDNRDYYVYTPLGYDPAARTRYPVLYLLHGYSDDANGWTAVGKANLILDKFRSALIDEVIPAVEHAYNIDSSRDAHAPSPACQWGRRVVIHRLEPLG